MHVKNEAAYHYIDQVQKYLDTCEVFVGEMDLNDPVLAELHDYFTLSHGQTLRTLYGEHKYLRLHRTISKAYGVDLDEMISMKPMIVTNVIAEKILTATYDMSLDHYLWSSAQRDNKELRGLESGVDQIEILKNIPMSIQKKMLLATISNVSNYRKKVYSLSSLYEYGQVAQLYKTTKKSLGELRKPLLYDRNYYMADRIVELTEDGKSSFFAFGAAHLLGKFGVLRLLKKSGFKIRPIKLTHGTT